MKALVKYGQKPDQVELREVPVPSVRPGTVLVKVMAVGVCGWDIEMWRHRMANPVAVPVIQGHEFSGTIAAVGPQVTGWRKGDAVVCETSAEICGACEWCRSGNYQLCPDRKGFGYGVDGAFASYVVARQAILHAKPPTLSFAEAALTEPFCVGHHALVDQISLAPGDTVLVIGPGPIGLICLQMARALGAASRIVLGTDRDQLRLNLARDLGWADTAINVSQDEPLARIMELTRGRGVDVVADCAGNSQALATALGAVRRAGRIVKIGWGPQPFNHSLDELLRKSAALVGTFGHNQRNWQAVLQLLAAGQLQAKPLISEILPLARWRKAFELVENCQAIKMILEPEHPA